MGTAALRARAKRGAASSAAIAVLDVLDPGWRDDLRQQRWLATLSEVERWRDLHGRLPGRLAADETERRLGRWLGTQRQALAGTSDGAESFARNGREQELDRRLPGWRPSEPASWNDRLDELRTWLADNGLPRDRSSDSRERRISVWLFDQRAALASGELSPEHASAIEDVLPGWPDARQLNWEQRLRDVAAFHSELGRLPARSGATPRERRLHAWVAYQRELDRSADEGFATSGRAAQLDAAVPGWRGRRRSV